MDIIKSITRCDNLNLCGGEMTKGRTMKVENVECFLSDQQILFVEEYMKDLNPLQAALRSGYHESSAALVAQAMMKNINVQERIKQKQHETAKRNEINEDYLVKKLVDIIEGEDKTADRIKAIQLLGKHLGMFEKKIAVEVKPYVPIEERLLRFERYEAEHGEEEYRMSDEDGSMEN